MRLFTKAIIIILFTASTLFTTSLSAKTYFIDQITIRAEILPDGSLSIEETRQYQFKGHFHWADYEIPLANLGEVQNFSIIENDKPFIANTNDTPGTYRLEQNRDRFYVKWFYSANNETRSFTLKYKITDAVTVYDDIAEFYYKFVGEAHPKTIGLVNVELALPFFADTSHVRAWVHGPLNGELQFIDGKIRMTVHQLPHGKYWETRTIFPPDWVPSAVKRISQNAQKSVFDEETQWADEANIRRLAEMKRADEWQANRKKALEYGIYLASLCLFLWGLLYLSFGKGHTLSIHDKYSEELPDLSPAVTHYLYTNGQMQGGAIVATIFDLARRGFLNIKEVYKERKIMFKNYKRKKYILKLNFEKLKKDSSSLTKPEINILSFLFNTLANQKNELDLAMLSKKQHVTMKWFSKWKKLVQEEWGNKPLFDKRSIIGVVLSSIIAMSCIGISIYIIVNWNEVGLISFATGIILLGLSFAILRYTPEVKELKTRITGSKQYLSKMMKSENSSENLSAQLDRFFVFAVALGFSSGHLKKLLRTIPPEQQAHFFPWYYGMIDNDSPVAFVDAATSMVNSISTAMSSAAGVSGGASVGGGGGAGGAAGGAG